MTFARWVFCVVVCAGLVGFARADTEPRTLAQGPALPVLAWGGIPWNQATPERFAELAGAGFTHSYSGAPDADTMEKLLDMSHAWGVRQFISIPELESDPQAVARRFKDHPGLGGYYLRDEPGAGLFPQLAKWARQIQSVDNVNPCYVNLFPTYGVPEQWETPDYATYLERFVAEVPTPMLSFDHYPVIREGPDESSDRLRPDFYENLELASAAARESGRPLWAFALATAHNPYPIPTVAHLRVQAFSDLAYGAQVIQYFTYWTSKSTVWNFHQGPIEVDGSRTPTYDRVKQVNAEMQALRGAFVGSTVVSVGHTGENLPRGTTRYVPATPVTSLETRGPGAAVSVLSNEHRRLLVVVNRDIHKPMPLEVTFDPAAETQAVTKDGTLRPIDGSTVSTVIEAGDVAVFMWMKK